MRRVLFAGGGTGGHLYPALALADAMKAAAPDVEVHFVGAERGIEARVLPERGVAHTLLPIEPFRRSNLIGNWRLVPSLARSFASIRSLFRSLAPRLVVGTGGYASAPACAWAVTRGVPVVLQEQNAQPGLTTRLLSRWASQIHLGFPEAATRLRIGARTRVLELGNPIRPPDPSLDRKACRRESGLADEAIVMLVVGGSQGARGINNAVLGWIEAVAQGTLDRPSDLELLWATGPGNFEAVQRRLDAVKGESWYRVSGYIDDMPRALAAADIAVSRAGAMMTAELLAWGIPSILVPLPTSAEDHQTKNARALESAGTAFCIEERALTPAELAEAVSRLAGDRQRLQGMAAAARGRARPDAARDIVRELLTLIPAEA